MLERPVCRIPADWFNDPSMCWYEWQGALAAIAGAGTIYFLWKQISHAAKIEKQRISRQHKAVRTTLPLALSGLCAVMKEMLKQLAAAKSVVRQDGHTRAFNISPPPSEYVEALKAVVASTDERSVSEPIAQIIREVQTLWARAEILQSKTEQRRRAGLILNITEWMIQAAQIHALVESLFPYSRGETELGPLKVEWSRAESVIFQLGLEDGEIVESIRTALEKSKVFWVLK